jgi:phosphoglucosamine mutase
MSNFGLEAALKRNGLKLVRTDVGDRYVVEAMLRDGCNLGGEQSGHLLFLDGHTTGDGILSCLKVLEVMLRSGKRLSELTPIFERFPQVVVSAKVREKPPLEALAHVAAAVKRTEEALDGRGRVNVRYSGTSKLIRVMVEGEDEGVVRTLAQEILDAAAEDGIVA